MKPAPHLAVVRNTEEARLERTGNVPEQLRKIAEDIESGTLVGVHSGMVILKHAEPGLMIYGIADGDPVARLNAAYMLLSLARTQLEQIAADAD